MGLIKCPECGKEISDKADVCIGCGFPIKKYRGIIRMCERVAASGGTPTPYSA